MKRNKKSMTKTRQKTGRKEVKLERASIRSWKIRRVSSEI